MKTTNELKNVNFGLSNAKFKIINELGKFTTIAECLDTPKEINKMKTKLEKKYKNLWLITINGKKPLF